MIEHLKNVRLFLSCDAVMTAWTVTTCVSIGFIYIYAFAAWVNP
jgi:hypothetical protein